MNELEPPISKETKKRSFKFPGMNPAVRFATATVVVGLSAYGAYSMEETIRGEVFSGNGSDSQPLGTKPVILTGFDALDNYYSGGLLGKDAIERRKTDAAVESYLQGRSYSIYFADYELKTNHSEDTLNFIAKQRKTLVVDGLDLLIRHSSLGKRISYDEATNKAMIEGLRDFDMSNIYDLTLLDGIITTTINSGWDKLTDEDKYLSTQKFNDILWLVYNDLPIVIDNDVFLFPKDNILVDLSRLYKKIEELGYPLPSAINFVRYKPENGAGIGWYDDGQNAVYVTNEGDGSTVVHEEGHHQAARNQKFRQAVYNDFIGQVIDRVKSAGENLPLDDTFVTDYPKTFSDPVARKSEDFADTFMIYFTDGPKFRRTIELFNHNLNPAWEVVDAKFKFLKLMMGGEEYIKNGEALHPQVGDKFQINDSDKNKRGIALRRNPDSDTSDSHAVYDEDDVLIIGGPVSYADLQTGEIVKFWLVRDGFVQGQGAVEYPKFYEGWISEQWFGNISTHSLENNLVRE